MLWGYYYCSFGFSNLFGMKNWQTKKKSFFEKCRNTIVCVSFEVEEQQKNLMIKIKVFSIFFRF
jgi:hypothetical protein